MRRQLGAVVAAQPARRATPRGDERLKHLDSLVGADRALAAHDERLAGELVDDVGQPQRPAVGGLVMLKVDRPHLVRRAGHDLAPAGPAAGPRALARPSDDAQALLAPQALHPLAVDLPAG
jgi:hypothetical protein